MEMRGLSALYFLVQVILGIKMNIFVELKRIFGIKKEFLEWK